MAPSRWLTRLSPPPGARFRLTRDGGLWLLVAVMLLIMSWLRGLNLLLLLAYLMLLIWTLNFFLAGRRLRLLKAQRHIDGPIFAQTPFRQCLEIVNEDRRPQYGLRLSDDSPVRLPGDCFVVRILGKETIEFGAEVTLPSRGRFPCAGLRAASGYPFGLVDRSARIGAKEDILVLPQLGTLHREKLRQFLRQRTPAIDGPTTARRPEFRLPAGFHGIRPYAQDDNPRWIHWRSSARHGELMVREFEPPASENLVLVVDPSSATEAVLEDTISLAATVGWEWSKQKENRLLLIIAGSAPIVVPGGAGLDDRAAVLEPLADLTGQNNDWEKLRSALVGTLIPAGPVLVIGAQPDELVDRLTDELRRPVVPVRTGNLDAHDFYERPAPHVS